MILLRQDFYYKDVKSEEMVYGTAVSKPWTVFSSLLLGQSDRSDTETSLRTEWWLVFYFSHVPSWIYDLTLKYKAHFIKINSIFETPDIKGSF